MFAVDINLEILAFGDFFFGKKVHIDSRSTTGITVYSHEVYKN